MELLEENAFGSKIAQPLAPASQLIQMTSSWHIAGWHYIDFYEARWR